MGRNVKWNNLFLLGEDEIFFEREREREDRKFCGRFGKF